MADPRVTPQPGDEQVQIDDLRSTLRQLRGRAVLIIFCCLAGAAAAYVASSAQTKKYASTASLLFRDARLDQTLFGSTDFGTGEDPARAAATNLELVSLATVALRTSERLKIPQDLIMSETAVQAEGQSNVVTLTVQDPNPEQASKIANTFAEEFIAFRRAADQDTIARAKNLVDSQLRALTPAERDGKQGEDLRKRGEQLSILSSLQTGNAELVQRAGPSTAPSFPLPKHDAIIGALLGLIFGLGVVLLRDRFDRRIRSSEELAAIFELPLLAEITASRDLGDTTAETVALATEADEFQLLRARLRYFDIDRDIRVLMVTSEAPGEGKTTVATHLAATAAAMGSRVILVEGDMRRPVLSTRLGFDPLPGLAELLTQELPYSAVIRKLPLGEQAGGDARDLHIIPAGLIPPNPAELMESHRMYDLLDQLQREYDLVMVDTPPTSVVADAIPLFSRVNGVIVVGRVNVSTRDGAMRLRTTLRSLNAPTLGVVANGVSEARGGRYDYAYGPSSYSSKGG